MINQLVKPATHAEPSKLRLVQKKTEGGSEYASIYLNGVELLLLGGDDSPVLTLVNGQARLRCTVVCKIDDG